ncbi:hypothetical protein ACX9NE_14430 [Mycobacterium sp. ML4]
MRITGCGPGLAVLTLMASIAAAPRQHALLQLDQAAALQLNSTALTMPAGIAPGGDMRAIRPIPAAPGIEGGAL